MKTSFYVFVISVFFLTANSFSQYKEWGTKFGFRYSQIFPENEFQNVGFYGTDDFSFDTYKFSFLTEGFIAFELSSLLELQFNSGYGYNRGLDRSNTLYESSIIPIDLRLRFSPFDIIGWNPYAYFGGGAIYVERTKISNTGLVNPDKCGEDGWFANFPVGLGTEIALSENVLLDLSFGGAITTSYHLDSYQGNTKIYDTYFSLTAGLTFTGESGSSDGDKDGLTKREESEIGTDPNNPDSDDDGLNDGDEVNIYVTNPLLADSDSDGLNDSREVLHYKTDPLSMDTDKDKLNDIAEATIYFTNPLIPDSDSDGLDDFEELKHYLTNPLENDTDQDRLTDYEETLTYKTNPKLFDSDADGLSDYEEVMIYKTNPNVRDTDGGTVDDLTEIKKETDPLNGDDDLVAVGVPIILEGITFEIGRSYIKPESESVLNQSLNTLIDYPDITIEIAGHTDNTGSKSINQRLSIQRAESVRNWLIRNGINPKRVSVKGYGPDRPVATNDTVEGRQKNRRIELKRIK